MITRFTKDPPSEMCQGHLTTIGWCERKPTVERDGKRYCWQHDPVRLRELSAKRLAQHKEMEAEIEARFLRDEDQRRRNELLRLSGVRDLTNQDLEQIIAAGGIWAFLPWRPRETDGRVND